MDSYISRIFYLGTGYHGSQWQPNVRTIQGELTEALSSWSGETYNPESIIFSGRTDKGVSSLGQVVRFDSSIIPDLEGINSHLPEDIVFWAYTHVPAEFNPRFGVLNRHYRYYLDTADEPLDLAQMKQAASLMIGLNNYARISKRDGDRPSLATILNISIRVNGEIVVFDFYGTNFLWKFVRKSITLLRWVGLGAYSTNIIPRLLNENHSIPGGIKPAPPEGLVFIEASVPYRMKPNTRAIDRIRNIVLSRYSLYAKSLATLQGISSDYLYGQMHFY
ncbi:MAG: tRNA pseudouridine(38-40) synthase TruA [Candidatus Thorarchaeota archaeon]